MKKTPKILIILFGIFIIPLSLILSANLINNKRTDFYINVDIQNNFEQFKQNLSYINQNYADDYANRLIVKSNKKINDSNAIYSADGFNGLNVLQYKNTNDTNSALSYYSSLEYVNYVERDSIVDISSLELNENANEITGEHQNELSWGSSLLGVPRYKDYLLNTYSTVANLPIIYVAVLDSGIDTDNEFLAGRIEYDLGISYVTSTLYTSGESKYQFEDDNKHGTHVSGTIVDLTLGNVKIIPIKVFDKNGQGTSSNVIAGLEYILNLKKNGTNICAINMSFGGYTPSYEKEKLINECYSNNMMPVVAAGNENYYVEKCSPANIQNALTISALSQNNKYENFPYFASYSNHGEYIDLCLPGTSVLSCVPDFCEPDKYNANNFIVSKTGGKYAKLSGTSMATPHATALVSLIASAMGDSYSVSQVEQKLKEATYDFGVAGKDDLYGYGVPNLELSFDKFNINNIPSLSLGEVNSICNFNEPFTLMLNNNYKNQNGYTYKIYYTLDGSYPTLENYQIYTSPVGIKNSTRFRFVTYMFDKDNNLCADSKCYDISYIKGNTSYNDDGTGFEIDDNGVLTKYTSGLENIIIPRYINGKKVKKLGSSLFNGLNIKNVICDYDIEVGYYPFYCCDSLKEININSSNVENLAQFCPLLETLTLNKALSISDGNESYDLLSIYYGSDTFYACYNLTTINIPLVTEIPNNAFSYYEKLSNINIDWKNIVSIGTNAFVGCQSFEKYLNFENLQKLGKSAFAESGIKGFCATNLKKVEKNVFRNCKKLEYIELPNVEILGSTIIYNSINLKYLFVGANCLKTSNNSLIAYNGNFNIYCYNTDLISQCTNQKCVDISSSLEKNDDNDIDYTFSGYNNVITTYSSNDENLSSDDIVVNKVEYSGLNIEKAYKFNKFTNENKYYITVLKDYVGNEKIFTTQKIGSNKIYNVKVSSNIEQNGLKLNGYSFNQNETVILNLFDIKGYKLVNIKLNNKDITSNFTNNSYSFAMPKYDVNIELEYKKINYKITTEVINSGTLIVKNELGKEINTANYNQNIEIFYSSEDNYISKLYYIDDIGQKTNIEINDGKSVLSMPNKNIKIVAEFNKLDLNDFLVWYNDDTMTYEISYYSGKDTIVNIPQYLPKYGKVYSLTKIRSFTFLDNAYIEQVNIISNEKNQPIVIGSYAFNNCINLKIVNAKGLSVIEKNAFEKCNSLKNISLENVTEIGSNAFKDCESITNINLENCKTFEKYAFYGCTSLISVTLGENIIIIPNNAFSYCENLEDINLNFVKEIGEYAFYCCENLQQSCISDNHIIKISDYAFANCKSLQEFYFPQLEILGSNSFGACDNIEFADLSKLKQIGSYPFLFVSKVILGSSQILNNETLEISYSLSYVYVDKDFDATNNVYLSKFKYNKEFGDYIVYSKYSLYIVNFVKENGDVISSQLSEVSNNIDIPQFINENGTIYLIKYWINKANNYVYASDKIEYIYEDTTFIAIYKSHKVTFKTESGFIISQDDYYYDDKIDVPKNVTINGICADIKSWKMEGTDKTISPSYISNIYKDTTYIAIFEKYKVTFKTSNLAVLSSKEYSCFENIDVPQYEIINGESVKINKWKDVSNSNIINSNDIKTTSKNVTYVAVLDTYLVTFKTESGEIISQREYTIKQDIVVPRYEIIDGKYVLISKWREEGTQNILNSADIKTTNKNVVYIAVIEGTQEKTYKINYYYGYDFDNSGKVNDAGDLIYSQNLKENETIVWKEFTHSYKKTIVLPIIAKKRFDGSNKFGMGNIFLKRNDFVFYPRRNLKIVITYEYTFEKWDKDLAGKTPNDIKEMFDCNNELEINALYSSEIVSVRIISVPFFPFIRFIPIEIEPIPNDPIGDIIIQDEYKDLIKYAELDI